MQRFPLAAHVRREIPIHAKTYLTLRLVDTAVLLQAGSVYTFGSGNGGACGTGSQEKYWSPQGPIDFPASKSPIVQISTANQRTICRNASGGVYLFGRGELGCPDLLLPVELSSSSFSQPRGAWLADCGSSTDIIIQDSNNSVIAFPWSSCAFFPAERRGLAPDSGASGGVRPVLDLALHVHQLCFGFLHGFVVVSSPEALFYYSLLEGDLASFNSALSSMSQASKQALFNFRDGRGHTVFHIAACCLHKDENVKSTILDRLIVDPLLKELIDVQNQDGRTALHYAVSAGRLETVRTLITKGSCNPDLQDANGDSPLHVVIRSSASRASDNSSSAQMKAIMKVLVLDGVCSLDLINGSGLNVVDFAVSLNLLDLGYELYTLGASVNIRELRARGVDWWLSIIYSSQSAATGSSAWICHANADWELAHRLQKSLVRSGIKASVDQWKFSPCLHAKVGVYIFLVTEISLKDERCLSELYQSVTEADGVIFAVVCEDLSSPIPPTLRRLFRRVLFAAPQTQKQETPSPSLAVSSASISPEFDIDHPLSEGVFEALQVPKPEDTAQTPTGPISAIPSAIFDKLKQMVSQALQQDRVPIKNIASLPNLPGLLEDCGVVPADAMLLDPARRFFSLLSKDRSVRIFVSSTFKDMQQERECLVGHVFPHVERYCLDRQISFSFVDLRWGITEEMSSSGQVITTCLREVERAHPYFLCMLGERYGWHDMSDITNMKDELLEKTFDNAVAAGYGWVDRFRDRSVTELEVIHGALRYIPSSRLLSFGEPIDYGYDASDELKEKQLQKLNSFFYLRDPSFIDSIKTDQKGIYSAENFLAKHKTFELREMIRSSELPWKGYRDRDSFYHHAIDDIVAAIDRQFSNEREPTPVEQENMRHVAFAKAHLQIHVPRMKYLERLHQHVNATTKIEAPLVFLSQVAGVGLSALMAYAASFYANLNPNRLVFFHFVRASDKSGRYYELMRRVIVAIHDFFNVEQPVPTEKDDIVADFPGWLQIAAERGGMLLFVDGLDQMANIDGSNELEWIPAKWPTSVRAIFSSASSLSAASRMCRYTAETVDVDTMGHDEKSAMISAILCSRSKTLSQAQRDTLVRNSSCSLPLYLKTLLDELTVEGSFETLTALMESYLRAKDPLQLYAAIVKRWSNDYGEEFVTSALSLILVAREGISEYELLDILKCSHAQWNRLYIPLKDSIVNRSGLLCFSNKLLERVVYDLHFSGPASHQLATYFWEQQKSTPMHQPLSSRVVAELPYHIRRSGKLEWFYMCLSDMRMFRALYTDEYMYELIAYWRQIEEAHATSPLDPSKMTQQFSDLNSFIDSAGGDIFLASLRIAREAYVSAGQPSRRDLACTYFKIGEFTREAAKYAASEEFYRLAAALQEKLVGEIVDKEAASRELNEDGQSITEELALSHDGLAFLFKTISQYANAAFFSVRAIEILDTLPMSRSVAYSFISALCNYSQILGKQVKLELSEQVAQRAVEIARANLPPYDAEVARAVNCLSVALKKLKNFAAAEPLARESLRLREKVCGPNHTFVSYSLMNVGNIYAKLKRFNEAVAAYERMYRITCEFHGANHPQGAQAKYSLGKLYLKFGHHAQASASLTAALQIALEIYGHDHALTKKICMKILDMVGYQENERLLFKSIASTIQQTVHFGLSTGTLVVSPDDGRIKAAVIDRKQVEASTIGVVREVKPGVTLYPPGHFARLAAAAEAARLAVAYDPPESPFQSSDEDCAEEAAFESSDEDMGFSLFD